MHRQEQNMRDENMRDDGEETMREAAKDLVGVLLKDGRVKVATAKKERPGALLLVIGDPGLARDVTALLYADLESIDAHGSIEGRGQISTYVYDRGDLMFIVTLRDGELEGASLLWEYMAEEGLGDMAGDIAQEINAHITSRIPEDLKVSTTIEGGTEEEVMDNMARAAREAGNKIAGKEGKN